jgi:hypothetical protein
VRHRPQRPPRRCVRPRGDDEVRRQLVAARAAGEEREILAPAGVDRDARLAVRARAAGDGWPGGAPPPSAAVRRGVDAERRQEAVVRRGQQLLRIARVGRDRRLALDPRRARDVDVDPAERPRVPDRPDGEVVEEKDAERDDDRDGARLSRKPAER